MEDSCVERLGGLVGFAYDCLSLNSNFEQSYDSTRTILFHRLCVLGLLLFTSPNQPYKGEGYSSKRGASSSRAYLILASQFVCMSTIFIVADWKTIAERVRDETSDSSVMRDHRH